MDNIIEINHLSKRFGDVRAVQDLSFRAEEGELSAAYVLLNVLQSRKPA